MTTDIATLTPTGPDCGECSTPLEPLRGREEQCRRLKELVSRVCAGESGALVIRGEHGIGKSALLDYVADGFAGCRFARAIGIESEMELPYAALHQLCLPILGGMGRLPRPQRDALETAFGLSTGTEPDRFLVGLAVLSLLSVAAEEQPVICLVDDTQWLDRSSALILSFVSRRVERESVLILFARSDGYVPDPLADLPEMRLFGLSEADARDLLASRGIGPLDERVLSRIIAETRGNPLALLELVRGTTPGGLEGGYALRAELPARIERSFRSQVEELPADTRQMLLLASTEPLGDPTLLWAAAERLEIPAEAIDHAQERGMIEIGPRVHFRHPLLRLAIYRSASPEERRGVHLALAEVTDPEQEPDRRAWHRAQAAAGPDEEVAIELELSADRARARGGLPAAAALLQRAVELTADPRRRASRALAAARAKALSGLPDAALSLLLTAQEGGLDELDSALAQRLRGEITLNMSRTADAAPLLLGAAKRLEPLDPALARETHLESLWAASSGAALGGGVTAAAEAARQAPPPPGRPSGSDLLLDGLAICFTDGYAEGVPVLERALTRYREELGTERRAEDWPWMATRLAAALLDDEAWNLFATGHVDLARNSGALSLLPTPLAYLAVLRMHQGDRESANTLLEEADALGPGQPELARLIVLAYSGDEAGASRVALEVERVARARGDGVALAVVAYGRSVLHNGMRQYGAALDAARRSVALDDFSVYTWALTELIEAAARSGESDTARTALGRLAERTQAVGTDYALGVEARARGLVSEGAAAETAYREAIEFLGRTQMRLSLARAHLVYGEWLRRENRRVDAREQLRTAYEEYSEMGSEGFAERARAELAATGERVRRRTAETRDDLTAQEAQIAALAAEGQTNPEIGAQLFLSPRTVEWHLRKVYGKLGIASRMELRDALPGRAAAARQVHREATRGADRGAPGRDGPDSAKG